jgi:hypothetical protein
MLDRVGQFSLPEIHFGSELSSPKLWIGNRLDQIERDSVNADDIECTL